MLSGQLWDRQQHRVDFFEEVRFAPQNAMDSFSAHATNISAAGVFLTTNRPCAVGTPVICEVPVGKKCIQVRGKVVRIASNQKGMGIKFVDVTEDAASLLRQIVGPPRDLSRQIKVKFEGMPEPVKAEALNTNNGICFRTALPFLRLNSDVEFSFNDGLSELGRLDHVLLRADSNHAVPKLQVHITRNIDEFSNENTLSGMGPGQSIEEMIEEYERQNRDTIKDSPLKIAKEILGKNSQKIATSSPKTETIDDYYEECVINLHPEPDQQPIKKLRGRNDMQTPEVHVLPPDEAIPLVKRKTTSAKKKALPNTKPNRKDELDPGTRSHWEFKGLKEELAIAGGGTYVPGMDPNADDLAFWTKSSPPKRYYLLWAAALIMAGLAITSAYHTGLLQAISSKAKTWTTAFFASPNANAKTNEKKALSVEAKNNDINNVEPKVDEKVENTPNSQNVDQAKQEIITSLEKATNNKIDTPQKAENIEPKVEKVAIQEKLKEPMVARTAAGTVIRIPYRGSLQAKQIYTLSKPYGLVIRLPHAQTPIKRGVFQQKDQEIRSIWVRPFQNEGMRIRVLYNETMLQHHVSFKEGILRILLSNR